MLPNTSGEAVLLVYAANLAVHKRRVECPPGIGSMMMKSGKL